MMKLCKEEKTVLRIEINKLSLLLVILFVYKAECQVPINGFCKLSVFNSDKGMNGIFSFDYNDDNYADLLLYSPNSKTINLLNGTQSDSFLNHKKLQISFQPSIIINVFNRNMKSAGYAFTSRKNRKAGFINFTSEGKPIVKQTITLSSYPDFISASDINNNNKPELLVSGGAFDGLSILSLEKNRLKETKVAKGTAYSEAYFSDISHDHIADIAAFNLLSRQLDIFYNLGNGEFRKVRSIPINEKIMQLKMHDINNDTYNDIVYSSENKITILSGTFNSDFTQTAELSCTYTPEKFITADFNNDKKEDIAYLDTKSGAVGIFFSSGKGYYPEILYLKKEHLNSITELASDNSSGIAVSDDNGNVYTINTLHEITGEVNIVPAIEPQRIRSFHNNIADQIMDISFVDNGDDKLKLFIRNGKGIPVSYYETFLSMNYNYLLTQSFENYTNFFLFSEGINILEIFQYNFSGKKKIKREITAPGNIIDLIVSEKKKNTYICSYDNKKLYYTVLDEKLNKTAEYSLDTGPGVKDALLTIGGNSGIYFWQYKGVSLNLYFSSLTNNLNKPVTTKSLPPENKKQYVTDNFINKSNSSNNESVFINKENICISMKKLEY